MAIVPNTDVDLSSEVGAVFCVMQEAVLISIMRQVTLPRMQELISFQSANLFDIGKILECPIPILMMLDTVFMW